MNYCSQSRLNIANVLALITLPLLGLVLVALTVQYFIQGHHKRPVYQKFHLT